MNKLASDALANIMLVEQKTQARRDDILKQNAIRSSIKYAVDLIEFYHNETSRKPCDMVAFFFTPMGLFPIVTEETQDFWKVIPCSGSPKNQPIFAFDKVQFNGLDDLNKHLRMVYNDYPIYYFSFPFAEMTADQPIDDEEFCRMIESILDKPYQYDECMCGVSSDDDKEATYCTLRYGLIIHMGTKAVTSPTGKSDLKNRISEINEFYSQYPELTPRTFDEES